MTRFIRSVVGISILLTCATVAFSQSRNTGEIRGTVSAGGAVVPNATVTLTNVDTGEIKIFTTNDAGIYDTVSTPAGTYRISFSAQGFKTLVRGPFVLQIDTITEDGELQVGAATETVTVEAEGAPILETETSHLGAIMESKTIQELPQIGAGITGNDWANFNVLLPGASGTSTAPGSEGSGSYNAGDAVAINGNLPNYANYLQDGGVVQLPVSNNVDNTLFEAVQEVQITTSAFSAQYGIGGAVFNQVTKSGTNRFHGSAYEYWQNDMLNASPKFWVNGAPAKPAYLRYHEWGGSVGGPIIKNKLFFFFVRDKIFNNNSNPPTGGTTPTLAERGMGTAHPGSFDFSDPRLPILYDPASCNTSTCRKTFASENTGALAGVNAIPANRIDPVALKILNYYPSPNAGAPGDIQNNFSTILPTPNPNLRWFGRIDYDLSQKHHLSFSISQKDNPGVNKYGPFPCPINCFSGDIDGYNVQLTHTWQISSTIVNEFRMAYTKQGNWFVPDTKGFDAAGTLGLQYAKANIFPSVNIGGNGLCCNSLAPGTNAIYIEHLYDPSDVLTLVRGRHILHFGVEVLMGEGNTTPWGNVDAGQFTFTGNYTANGAGTGAGLADFLLGDVQHWQATNQSTSYARLKSPQLFVQDDFKVRPNLTLNLGLRYTATTGFSEINNSLGGFDPNLTLVCSVDKNGLPCGALNGTVGSMWFAPQNNRTTLQKPVRNIFLPRVGFAWSPKTDTVVRGGFGIYSYNFSQDVYGNGIGVGGLGTSTGNTSDPLAGAGPNPLVTLSAPASVANPVLNYVVGSPNAKNVSQYLNVASPSNQTYVPYDVKPGQIREWQLSVEHQFKQNYMASIAYVGSHAEHLETGTDLNQITSPAGLAAAGAGNGALIQANRPFPAWGNLSGYNYNGISNYHALQTTINKQFSNGLVFSFNYVWSHFLDDQDSGGWGSRGGTQYWQVGNDPSASYGNSNFDIPNAFKGYASYELPFGKGKSYLSGNSVLDEVVGGWKIAGTFIAQSGVPFTVVNVNNHAKDYTGCADNDGGTASGGDVNNGCNWFPNVIASTHVSNPGPNGWFNTAAFADAWTAGSGLPFAFGNERRNMLRGPRLSVLNLSFGKEFKFGERVRLQLRSDWVNALNHPSLGIPGQTFGGANFGLINNNTQGNGVAVKPRSGQLSARVTF